MLRYLALSTQFASRPPGDTVHGAKILIADDSPLVLRMIEKMLEGAGFSVITAHDGLEAVERALAEDVQLVILDLSMPRMTGYQACRLLKNEPATRELPVVILTSRDQAGDRFWGLETGADHYVTKDADPQQILDLVRSILPPGAAARPRLEEAHRSSVDILSRVNELLDRRLYEATILSEIGRVARSLVRFDETFTSVMALVGRVADFTLGAMAFLDGDELDVYLLQQRPVMPAVMEEMKASLRAAVLEGRGGAGLGRVHARLFAPASGTAAAVEPVLSGFRSTPIVSAGRLAGMLALGGRHVARLGPESDSFLQQVAGQAHIVLQNSRLFERVQQLAIRDGLTELFNHRHTVEIIQQEVGRVARYPESALSVLMLDVDHFKGVNDRLGHAAGDTVLRELARVLREAVRGVDSVGRYGGEEFVVVLPQTRHEEARRTAERLRQLVEQQNIPVGDETCRVTVSAGVATFPSERVDSASTLLREADLALYRAKEGGRNRVA
jgi:two-component system, cell cycle response regulator